MVALRTLAVLASMGLACTAAPKAKPWAPRTADTPYDLTDGDDLDMERERFDVLGPGPARTTLRLRLAAEYARRTTAFLASAEPARAYQSFQRLVGLWNGAELAAGAPALWRYAPLAQELRRVFARSGGDFEATAALVFLVRADSNQAEKYRKELDEIFTYADQLSVAKYGDGAQRARPIKLLESVVDFFPEPTVVERLVKLYIARQQDVDSRVRRNGADFNLIRAHGADVLRTGWRIVAVMAKSDRLADARAYTEQVVGVGDDRELRKKLISAFRPRATPADWLDLATSFRDTEESKSDLEALLAVVDAGLARLSAPPSETQHLLIAAGDAAFDQDRVQLATHYYERASRGGRLPRRAAERLCTLYEAHITSLALRARTRAATSVLTRFETFYAKTRNNKGSRLTPDLADAYAAMARGLLSSGQVELAQRYLLRANRERPTLAAYEYLGTVALKIGRASQALAHFERALELPVQNGDQQFRQTRLMRLAGEPAIAAGESKRGQRHLRAAMKQWEQIVAQFELTGELLADLLVETGKIQWSAGNPDSALAAFEAAVDSMPNNEGVHAEVVAYLLSRGKYRSALDAYHRALGSSEITDEMKVYMSLWVVAEGGARGEEPDPLAADYLRSRRGQKWQDALGRFASGKISLAELRPRATTARQRNELLFYTATLLEARRNPARAKRLLRRVVSGELLLDFEYDMARHWLGRPMRTR